ncbi:MAG: HEPN domain-containing protein [Elusimicrobia bacterium]|nr:HEPN domain-containing protein [Elusimicrobiota bacterium]
MAEKLTARLLAEGKLRRQKAGIGQIEGLLRQAMLDLSEARKTAGIAERATYIMAYMAMLKAGRALLLLHGYVPDDGAQHRTVVEFAAAKLGSKWDEVTIRFERMRRKRNDMTYEPGVMLSRSEALQAFNDAATLVRAIIDIAKAADPQVRIPFKMS